MLRENSPVLCPLCPLSFLLSLTSATCCPLTFPKPCALPLGYIASSSFLLSSSPFTLQVQPIGECLPTQIKPTVTLERAPWSRHWVDGKNQAHPRCSPHAPQLTVCPVRRSFSEMLFVVSGQNTNASQHTRHVSSELSHCHRAGWIGRATPVSPPMERSL